MILINEILYQDGEETIFKTMKDDLYGMHSSKRGMLMKPSFLHIFKFKESFTVVVDKQEEYLEMDYNGITSPLAAEKKALYNKYLIKNSRCNCYASGKSGSCQLCHGYGQIFNKVRKKTSHNSLQQIVLRLDA